MQLISKYNKLLKFLLCVINFYIKYASVFSLKDKTRSTAVNMFQNNINTSNHKPNKIWVDRGSKFYNEFSSLV